MFNRGILLIVGCLVAGCSASTSIRHDAELPGWVIGSSSLEDGKYFYIVCASEGLDPEAIRISAENQCIVSAAKTHGVSVTAKNKSIQSLSGTDSGEVVEVSPIVREAKCDFIKRYLEETASGFRLWLMCRTEKGQAVVTSSMPIAIKESPRNIAAEYKKGTFVISSIPAPEKIVIEGQGGARVIDTQGNVNPVEIHNGDEKIIVKRTGFKEYEILISDSWMNNETLSATVHLEREF